MYIGLLAMGFLLMWVEAICLCAKREMNALKINAFAAMCTVLSGRGEGLVVIAARGHALLYFLLPPPICVSPKA